MMFVTGDTHCPIDISKINTKRFRVQRELTKADCLIVCGDAGFVWAPGSGEDRWWQDWLDARNFTTLFVDGNHENHQALRSYPVETWHGGKIHRIRPSVLHLMRGQIYEIEGRRVFAMGGASSADRIFRKEGTDWWPQELPCAQEYQEAWENLGQNGWKVDVVVTHTAPSRIVEQLGMPERCDPLTDFLQQVEERLTYHSWYFGHFHEDRRIDARHTLLYQSVLRI